jgi:ADP-ribosylation factor GTPase-activating protein 2/3
MAAGGNLRGRQYFKQHGWDDVGSDKIEAKVRQAIRFGHAAVSLGACYLTRRDIAGFAVYIEGRSAVPSPAGEGGAKSNGSGPTAEVWLSNSRLQQTTPDRGDIFPVRSLTSDRDAHQRGHLGELSDFKHIEPEAPAPAAAAEEVDSAAVPAAEGAEGAQAVEPPKPTVPKPVTTIKRKAFMVALDTAICHC